MKQLLFGAAVIFLLMSLIHDAFSFTSPPKAAARFGNARSFPCYESAGDNSKDDWFDDYDTFVAKLDFTDWGKDESKRPLRESRGNASNSRPLRMPSSNNRRIRDGTMPVGHDFKRAPDDDISDAVDLAAINSLLAERIACKRKSDFISADKIRDELLEEHGVVLWDKERIWTTNRDSRGGGARHRGNGRYVSSRGSGSSSSRPPSRSREFSDERDFGPTGHDYTQTGGPIDSSICTLQENQINELLEQRLKYKMSRKFKEADQIRSRLSTNGVSVHDGFKQWRADGIEWVVPEKQRRPRKYSHRKKTGDPELPMEQMDEILGQIILRADAKKTGDFTLADSIKTYLADRYSVIIDDAHYEWFFQSDSYTLSVTSSPFLGQSDWKNAVEAKLKERSQAKTDKSYAVADAIRDELFEAFHITIDDRTKEYTYNPPSASGAVSTEGVRDNINEVLLATPSELLESEFIHDAPTSSENDRKDLEALTVPSLKEKLREKCLPVSGRKDELIDRLLSHGAI